jgi:uncharacterized protein
MSGSAVYEGWVAHRRLGEVPHSFRYRVLLPLLDLDELPELLDRVPLWSARRPAPARFRDRDYLPREGGPLPERARDLVEARLGRRPEGSVRLLANPRYLGIGFNPVSFLFLHSAEGELDSVIAEVTNTPWGERATYVLDGHRSGPREPLRSAFAKRMHVSPFQPMEQTYDISVTEPGERLGISIRNLEEGREAHVASLALRRFEPTRGRLLGALLRYPPMTAATLVRIYLNALRLKLRGARVHPHPEEVRVDEQAVRVSELSQRQHGDRLARGTRFRDHGQAERRRRDRPRGVAEGRRGRDGRAGG